MLMLLGPPPPAPQDTHVHDEAQSAQERRHEETEARLPTLGWLGVRPALEDLGLGVEAFLTSDASIVLDGGVDTGEPRLRSLLDVSLWADTERLIGLPGGKLFLDLQLQHGRDGSVEVGDLQAFSNIDAPDFTRVAELWYEQRIEPVDAGLRVGRMDANGQFAWVEHGLRFVNSSMGFSPTIVGLPTYPAATFGASLSVAPVEGVELRAGVFDAEPSGSFLISQLDLGWASGRLGLGAWRNTGSMSRFDGGSESGTEGLFATLDQELWRGLLSPDDSIGAFLQLGEADPAVSPVAAHLGIGATWQGIGDDGSLGLGLSRARLSDEPGAGFGESAETAVELFYSFGIGDWLRLKPDLQYIADPGGDPSLDNAWVFTLRATVSL